MLCQCFVLWSFAFPCWAESASRLAEKCTEGVGPAGIQACTSYFAKITSKKEKALALANRGIHRNNEKLFKEAISDFDEAISLHETMALAFVGKGFALANSGRFDEALECYNRAVALDPSDHLAHANKSGVLQELKRFSEAADSISQAMKLAPRHGAYRKIRAPLNFLSGRYDGALDDYNKLIETNPENSDLYSSRAAVYVAKGQNPKAFDDFSKSLKINPNSANSLYYRSKLYASLSKFDLAIADLDRAFLTDVKDPAVLQKRGEMKERLGKTEEALTDYRAAIALSPRASHETEAITLARARISTLAAGSDVLHHPSSPELSVQSRKVALVIGNGSYIGVSQLTNPSRDAAAVAESFRQLGFDKVLTANDQGSDAMRRMLLEFGAEASKADWAIVYYAGHGIEVGGVNYLIPVDAKLRTDRDVQFEAIALDQVLGSVEGASKLRLIILDACRDNPFISKMSRTVASRSVGRGLARVEPEGATLIAYSAKGGQLAMDGDGQNSPFVTSFLKHLEEPGVEIRWLFSLVRDDVLKATDSKQEPFTYGSLPAQKFFFKDPAQ